MNKIYCENCKYHYFPNIDGSSIYDYCTFFKCKFFEAMRSYFLEPECDEINKNNNCQFYKRKWWKFWVK